MLFIIVGMMLFIILMLMGVVMYLKCKSRNNYGTPTPRQLRRMLDDLEMTTSRL